MDNESAYIKELKNNIKTLEDEIETQTLQLKNDIERRKKIEERLVSSQQKLALHINQTPLGVIEWNKEFEVVEWNPGAEKIFGFTSEEAMGKHSSELILPASVRELVDEIWQELIHQKGGTRSTNENLTKDGKVIFCEWYNTPLVDSDGVVIGVASLVQDITERRIQELQLLDAREKAEIANEAKSEFLSNISHELRTPLHGILGFSQLGLKNLDKGNEDKIRSYFERIIQSGERLKTLLNDILDLSKLEAGQMIMDYRSNNIEEVLWKCIEDLESLSEESNIKFDVIFNQENRHFYFDKIRISQVLYNIMGNAIKYSPLGGKIKVAISFDKEIDKKDTHIPACEVSVKDEGSGILEEEIEDIFNKFIQSKKNKTENSGTGLGLAISKEVVVAHGGIIWAENNENCGASFTFRIPISRHEK